MRKTTVTVDEKTKEQLAHFGKKGESFDVILQRVMSNTDSLCSQKKIRDSKVQEE